MGIWLVEDGVATPVTAADARGSGESGVDWLLVAAEDEGSANGLADASDRSHGPRWAPEHGICTGAVEGAWNVWRWLDDLGEDVVCVGCEATLEDALDLARRRGGHQVQYGISGTVYGV